jgi:hypothetical protein
MIGLDYTHPLHAASLYIDDLKYGPGDRKVEGATREQMIAQLVGLLRDAGVENVDAAELIDDCSFYGASLAVHFRLHPTLAKSAFVDELVHGIAVAGGLKGTLP